MSFDPTIYAQLVAASPEAANAYLASTQAPAAAPAPVPAPVAAPAVPQATFQQAQSAAQPQAARGTLEDFFNQPTGGGGPSVTSKFFNQRIQGSWLQLTVASDVTNADVQHQKTPQGVLQYFKKNGQDDLTRPKLVLVVKVQVTGSSDGTHTTVFPDGQASLWLKKGPVTDNLCAAMAAAGDPSGFPKGGAQMVMQSAGEQASRTVGFNATKLYDFQYAAPAATADPTPSVTAPAPSIAPAIAAAPVTVAEVPPTAPTAPATQTVAAPPAVPTVSAPPAVPAPAPNFTAPPAPPQISVNREALLAQLSGQA